MERENTEQTLNIKIGGRAWKIIFSDLQHQEGKRGSNYKELQEIHLNPSQHIELSEVTLIHEILHACCDFAGMEDEKMVEEQWVVRVAPILTQVLKDNPNILKDLDIMEDIRRVRDRP